MLSKFLGGRDLTAQQYAEPVVGNEETSQVCKFACKIYNFSDHKGKEERAKNENKRVFPPGRLSQNSLTPNNYPLSTRNVSRQILVFLFVRNLKAK